MIEGLVGLGLLAGATLAESSPRWETWRNARGANPTRVLLNQRLKIRARSRNVTGRFSVAEIETAMGERRFQLIFFEDTGVHHEIALFKSARGAERYAEKIASRGTLWVNQRVW